MLSTSRVTGGESCILLFSLYFWHTHFSWCFPLSHPAGVVTTVFVMPGKMTVKNGDGGDAGIKID